MEGPLGRWCSRIQVRPLSPFPSLHEGTMGYIPGRKGGIALQKHLRIAPGCGTTCLTSSAEHMHVLAIDSLLLSASPHF